MDYKGRYYEPPGLHDKSQGPLQHPPLSRKAKHEVWTPNKRIVGTKCCGGSIPCLSLDYYKSDPARVDSRSLEDSDLSPLAKNEVNIPLVRGEPCGLESAAIEEEKERVRRVNLSLT